MQQDGSTAVANGVPALLGLDWGTSRVRAFLQDGDGNVLATRVSEHGVQNLPQAGAEGFRQAFASLTGDWLQQWPALPVVAAGMVGSAQGWVEAPYVPCPADARSLAEHAVVIDTGPLPGGLQGVRVTIAPGVLYAPRHAGPDVMRGEEIQIAGVLARQPEWTRRSCVVLPGTHTKWAYIDGARIDRFSTFMTGELYAVLGAHSILGRLFAEPAEGDTGFRAQADAAFERGVGAARSSQTGDLAHQLFSVRTLGLTGQLAPTLLRDYLSGLLIGHELIAGLAVMRRGGVADVPLVLIGDTALCHRYARAFALMGVLPAALLENTAPAGLFQFASAAGLLPGRTATSAAQPGERA